MNIIKNLLLLLMFLNLSAFAYDARLNSYPDAKSYYDNAIKGDATAAFNLAVTYHKTIGDNNKAIYWYKKAYGMDDKSVSADAANDLGFLEDRTLKNYKKAEIWYKKAIEKGSKAGAYNLAYMYDESLHLPKQAIALYKKAYEMGQIGAANSIGLVYKNQLKNYPKAIKWLKIAAKQGDKNAINSLGGTYYHNLKDNTKAAAYILAMANYGYTKKQVIKFLTKNWKIDQATIKKAYQLQKTLDIPKHYYDRELEEASSTSHTRHRGRR